MGSSGLWSLVISTTFHPLSYLHIMALESPTFAVITLSFVNNTATVVEPERLVSTSEFQISRLVI